MAQNTRELLRSALEDLNQALRSMFGYETARPQLVLELLVEGRRPRPRRPAPRRVRRRRPRLARRHLALVR